MMCVLVVHSFITLLSIVWFGSCPNSFVIPIHEIVYDIETIYQSGVVILHFVQLLEMGKWMSRPCLNAIVGNLSSSSSTLVGFTWKCFR